MIFPVSTSFYSNKTVHELSVGVSSVEHKHVLIFTGMLALSVLYPSSVLAVPCPILGLLSSVFSFANPPHLPVCVVESGLAGVFLLVCGLEERVSQMLPQRRHGQRSHSDLHAGLYPASKTSFTVIYVTDLKT